MEDHKEAPAAEASDYTEELVEIDEAEKSNGKSSSSSSSESDSEGEHGKTVTDKIWRLFGREKPVHAVLGGGKPADVLLWKNKKISGAVLGSVTAIWVLFELLEYHLVTLVCHFFLIILPIFFLWSKAITLINKSPPHIPEFLISEDLACNIALAMRIQINEALTSLRCIMLGQDLRKFLAAVAGLWILSMVGSSLNFLTLFYIVFILLHTVPALYDKYEDKVDPCAEKAVAEIKRRYYVIDANVRSKIAKGAYKLKKNE